MERTYRLIEDQHVQLDDGSDFSHAVLKRCDITYSGGALLIEGAQFIECRMSFEEGGENFQDLQQAIFASLHAQGYRQLLLEADGTYRAV